MLLVNSRSSSRSVPQTSQTWLPAVLSRFPDFPSLAEAFKPTPDTQEYCALNLPRAVEMGDAMPSLTRSVKAFGRKQVADLIGAHLAAALVAMGEDQKTDPTDVRNAASSIVTCSKWGHLRFSTVIGFFHALRTGEYQIFGDINPRKILEAYQKYCAAADERESLERHRIEREKERREEEESSCYDSWEECMRRRGLPPETTFVQWIKLCNPQLLQES